LTSFTASGICSFQHLLYSGFQLIQGPHFTSYEVSYTAHFPAFAANNKGPLTCIQDTADSAGSVTALERCNESLVEWLWEQGGSAGQMLILDIWIGEKNILWMPWRFIKDDDHEC
jgi:hypothetical protein